MGLTQWEDTPHARHLYDHRVTQIAQPLAEICLPGVQNHLEVEPIPNRYCRRKMWQTPPTPLVRVRPGLMIIKAHPKVLGEMLGIVNPIMNMIVA